MEAGMSIQRKNVTFASEEIQLEGVLGTPPQTQNAPGVVICHPHPQMGGSMDNNVVYGLFDEFVDRGFVALAFNFRGTGRSGGCHDGGTGEITDVLAALDTLRGFPETDDKRLGLVGYSFGAWVALQAAARAENLVRCVGAVAPPVEMLPFDFLNRYSGPLFFVWGDRDPFCPAEKAERLIEGFEPVRERKQIDGSDHFFLGRERDAASYLCDRFAPLLLSSSREDERPEGVTS
jgi:alpha/beta superfamily hydrolase